MSNNKIDVSKCRFYNNGCDSHILCPGDDDVYGDCYFKQSQRLKTENEELRSDNSMLLAQADADAFTIGNLNFKIQKLQQCLNEIEEIVKNTCINRCTNDCLGTKKHCGYGQILQKIKEVKG